MTLPERLSQIKKMRYSCDPELTFEYSRDMLDLVAALEVAIEALKQYGPVGYAEEALAKIEKLMETKCPIPGLPCP